MTTTQTWQFKTNHSLDRRRAMSQRLRETYPDRVPVIIETGSPGLTLNKVRFLAPHESTLQRLFVEVRKQVLDNGTPVTPDKALFLLFGDAQAMMPLTRSVSQLYSQCRDQDDNMLYGRLMQESTFGQ